MTVLSELSVQAEAEGLLRQAASYQRGAEFFTLQDSPQKLIAYRRFRTLFDEGFADVPWVRHDVAWENGATGLQTSHAGRAHQGYGVAACRL